jgi:hypothetical protein
MLFSAKITEEIEVDAISTQDARSKAIKRLIKLLEANKLFVAIEEELDNYDAPASGYIPTKKNYTGKLGNHPTHDSGLDNDLDNYDR